MDGPGPHTARAVFTHGGSQRACEARGEGEELFLWADAAAPAGAALVWGRGGGSTVGLGGRRRAHGVISSEGGRVTECASGGALRRGAVGGGVERLGVRG